MIWLFSVDLTTTERPEDSPQTDDACFVSVSGNTLRKLCHLQT